MENIITTYGGGEALRYIFNGIAMILSLEHGFANNLLHLSGVIGILWSSSIMYMRSSLQAGMMWFGWFLLATSVLFIPRTSLIIKDELLPIKTYKVDNVPMVLAVISSSISQISNAFIKKMEAVFTLPDYLPYHKHGTIFASKMLAKAHEFKIVDPTFNSNMERFVNQCIVYDAMIGVKYSWKDLKTTEDMWALVSERPSKILGFTYRDQEANPPINSIVTCSKGVELLKAQWNKQIDLAAQTYGQMFFTSKKYTRRQGNGQRTVTPEDRLAKETFLMNLPISYTLLTGVAQDATKILQQEMMINVLRSGIRSKAIQYGQYYGNAKAKLQQKGAMEATGFMAAEFLPMLKTVFECILYASFIFVWIFALLPGGYMLLGMYFRELMWVQSWPILFAVLNLLCTIWSQHRTAGVLDGFGLNHINSLALSEVNETMQAITGWLSLSVPVLSRVVVTGSVNGLANLTGYLASSIQGIAGGAASELVSGNLSLGNVQYDTASVHQQSGFKFDRNTMYQAGQYMRNSERGALITNNAENTIYQGGEGRTSSTFGTMISSGGHMSQQLTEHADEETSLAKNDNLEYSSSIQASHRDAVDLLTKIHEGKSKGQSYGKDQSSASVQSINNIQDFATVLQKAHGVNDQEAFSLALGIGGHVGVGANAGFKSAGIKIDANGNYTTSSGKTISQSQLTDLATRHNYNENLDTAVRAFNNLQFSDNQGTEKSLADSAVSSYEKAQMYRESETTHLTNAEKYSNAASSIRGSSLDHKTVETDGLFHFIANSTGSSGKGINGSNYATKVMDASPRDKKLFEAQQWYIEQYKNQRAESMVNYVNQFKSKANLKQDYQQIKEMHHVPYDPNDLNNTNPQKISYTAKVEKLGKSNEQTLYNKANNQKNLNIQDMDLNLTSEKQQTENIANNIIFDAEIEAVNQQELLEAKANDAQKKLNEEYNRNVVVKETTKQIKNVADFVVKEGERIRELYGDDIYQ